MTHWCRDLHRDEAVRASEDGRSGPLPTLEECIERQKHAAMTAGVKEGFVKADGEWKRLTDDELRQILMIPKTVSASTAVEPKNKGDSMRPPTTKTATVENDFSAVTDRRPPEPGGGGNVTGGLRTERVVLSLARMGELIEERDAAIRERDRIRENAKAEHNIAKAALDERDAAIREREELRSQVQILDEGQPTAPSDLGVWCTAKDLSARCKELAARLVTTAVRASSAETALRQIVAQDYSRAAVNGASWKMHDIAEKALQSAPAASNSSEILTSSPAASGAAGTGWLTAEEREALTWWCGSAQPVDIGQLNDWCAAIRNLLARSSPPEVALPGQWKDAGGPGHPQVSWQPFLDTVTGRRDAEWLAALAAAGVTVKEVG